MVNIGPDPVTMHTVRLRSGDPAVFAMDAPAAPVVPARGTGALRGHYAPGGSGHHRAEVEVLSNDPAADPLLVTVEGLTTDASGRLRVQVEPAGIRLGRATDVTVVTTDSGSGTRVAGTARVDNYDASGGHTPFQQPTNQPFRMTFHPEKEWDEETKRWIMGSRPEGTVTVPAYEQDAGMPIPFRFS
ncbi:hypothetical protein SAMN05661080_03598 [Modestobacter sp. DSM 44400]|uniref:hypothetical protein n=1 Tax=Modestobacter sp. DSM 44400 TaxID=1550230 RepID=UPI000898F6AD|nr:hypothetical protein [Modestobacter sp. DSM 44400]SDY47825.1 hypothetical protein SAMN05661080_03598 [Modestobacter sp. DSM 44400]